MTRKVKGTRDILVATLALVTTGVYAASPGPNLEISYNSYAVLLHQHVDDRGMVSYKALKEDSAELDRFAHAFAAVKPETYQGWDEQAQVAFWINTYNALTLKAIIDHYPIKASFWKSRIYPKNSIRQIHGVWDELKFTIMGEKMTLEHIEHKILRVRFNEPRIHMALVCAAMSCPPLRNEPYAGDRLDQQLNDQTRRFLGNRDRFRIDRWQDVVYLSSIFKWFGNDFVKTFTPSRNFGPHGEESSAVLNFITGFLNEADQQYIRTGGFRVKYLDYDWSLNEREMRK